MRKTIAYRISSAFTIASTTVINADVILRRRRAEMTAFWKEKEMIVFPLQWYIISLSTLLKRY